MHMHKTHNIFCVYVTSMNIKSVNNIDKLRNLFIHCIYALYCLLFSCKNNTERNLLRSIFC